MLKLSDLDRQFVGDRETTDVYIGTNKNGDEIWFEVAQMQNPEHEKLQRRFSKQLERARRNPKKQRELQIEIVARGLLVGWRNLIDDDGNPVKCSVKNRIEILTKYREVAERVIDAAADITNFQDIDDGENPEEETEKNLGK